MAPVASDMTLTESRLGQVESRSHMTFAVEQAARLEGGKLINEHYTFNGYVKRRGQFLGCHSDYQHRKVGLFDIARRDAEEIFDSEQDCLSVQEVRRREVHLHIVPLLPLPTTANTETLDSFQSYPPTEWSPTLIWPPPRHAVCEFSACEASGMPTGGSSALALPPTRSRESQPYSDASLTSVVQSIELQAEDAVVSSVSFAPRTVQGRQMYAHGQIFSDGRARDAAQTLATLSGQSTERAAALEANSIKTPEGEQAMDVNDTSTSSPPLPASVFYASSTSPTMSYQPSTQATSPSAQGAHATKPHSSAVPTTTADPELIQSIIAALGTNKSSTMPSASAGDSSDDRGEHVYVDEGVSLRNRGISIPVKTKRGIKRAATPPETSQANDAPVTATGVEQPPAKRIRLVLKARTEPAKEASKQPASRTSRRKSPTPSQAKKNQLEQVVAERHFQRQRPKQKPLQKRGTGCL